LDSTNDANDLAWIWLPRAGIRGNQIVSQAIAITAIIVIDAGHLNEILGIMMSNIFRRSDQDPTLPLQSQR